MPMHARSLRARLSPACHAFNDARHWKMMTRRCISALRVHLVSHSADTCSHAHTHTRTHGWAASRRRIILLAFGCAQLGAVPPRPVCPSALLVFGGRGHSLVVAWRCRQRRWRSQGERSSCGARRAQLSCDGSLVRPQRRDDARQRWSRRCRPHLEAPPAWGACCFCRNAAVAVVAMPRHADPARTALPPMLPGAAPHGPFALRCTSCVLGRRNYSRRAHLLARSFLQMRCT